MVECFDNDDEEGFWLYEFLPQLILTGTFHIPYYFQDRILIFSGSLSVFVHQWLARKSPAIKPSEVCSITLEPMQSSGNNTVPRIGIPMLIAEIQHNMGSRTTEKPPHFGAQQNFSGNQLRWHQGQKRLQHSSKNDELAQNESFGGGSLYRWFAITIDHLTMANNH